MSYHAIRLLIQSGRANANDMIMEAAAKWISWVGARPALPARPPRAVQAEAALRSAAVARSAHVQGAVCIVPPLH